MQSFLKEQRTLLTPMSIVDGEEVQRPRTGFEVPQNPHFVFIGISNRSLSGVTGGHKRTPDALALNLVRIVPLCVETVLGLGVELLLLEEALFDELVLVEVNFALGLELVQNLDGLSEEIGVFSKGLLAVLVGLPAVVGLEKLSEKQGVLFSVPADLEQVFLVVFSLPIHALVVGGALGQSLLVLLVLQVSDEAFYQRLLEFLLRTLSSFLALTHNRIKWV